MELSSGGGALTNELARLLAAAAQRIPGLEVVVRDGTRIFADISQWQELERNGVSVTAAAPINLLGVSVNPVGKHGRRIPRGGTGGGHCQNAPRGVGRRPFGVR